MRALKPAALASSGRSSMWVVVCGHRHSHDGLDGLLAAELALAAQAGRWRLLRLGCRLLLQLLVGVNHEGKPVRDLGLERLLVVFGLVAEHGFKDDVLGARGDIEVLEEQKLTEHRGRQRGRASQRAGARLPEPAPMADVVHYVQPNLRQKADLLLVVLND